MRALVFGETGQVARELARAAASRGIEAAFLGRAQADLADPEACARAVAAADADIVLNAAAYTEVDRAEDEPALARTINAAAPEAMAAAAAARGLPFLHLSTDYVFDGAPGRPWREDDPTRPVNAYGATKLEGERLVAAANPDHAILRTAWVFSAHGRNFVRTMLSVGRGRDEMRVVGDQRGGPTWAGDIAETLWTVAAAWTAGKGRAGVFHYAGAPAVTWAGFAEAVFARSGWPARPKVVAIATHEWPTRAKRPANSVLDCAAIAQAYGVPQPDWRPALDRVVAALEETAA
jgi:dTDP-4-dehydrorhamnose reductase